MAYKKLKRKCILFNKKIQWVFIEKSRQIPCLITHKKTDQLTQSVLYLCFGGWIPNKAKKMLASAKKHVVFWIRVIIKVLIIIA